MTNPLLAKVKLPGRIFQLPSKGIFYDDGVLANHVKDAEIEVHPLSALAEMKLRSPDLIFSGRALREICLECIPDIIKPEALISKDVDAIFCFLKIVTYGSEMTIKSTHDCPNRNNHEYVVNVEAIIMNANNKILDNVNALYEATLSNDQKLILKPVTFQDSLDMTHIQQEVEKKLWETGSADNELIEKAIIRDLMSVISSVEGVSDKMMIEEWLRALQKKFFTEILDHSNQASEWGFNLNVELECKDCGDKFYHNLELNPINFFSG